MAGPNMRTSDDKTLDEAMRVADQVGDLAGATVAQGRDAVARVDEVAANVRSAVDKSVRDQPMTTLAMVAAFGFLLGAIWKS